MSNSETVLMHDVVCIDIAHANSHKEVDERDFRNVLGYVWNAARGFWERTATRVVVSLDQ